MCAKFQNDCFETLGGADYIIFYFFMCDGRTVGRTDGQEQNIMPTDDHGGIKKRLEIQ